VVQRRLFRSDKYLDDEDVRYIDGKAFVVHRGSLMPEELDEWASHDDHFFVDCKAESDHPKSSEMFEWLSLGSFKTCPECIERRKEELEERQRLMEAHEPLRGLELFAGAGGLSTGIDMSGFFRTLYAVEMSGSASLTYRCVCSYNRLPCRCSE
jgi:DNA (cytosine-5)-methyltransferase 1